MSDGIEFSDVFPKKSDREGEKSRAARERNRRLRLWLICLTRKKCATRAPGSHAMESFNFMESPR